MLLRFPTKWQVFEGLLICPVCFCTSPLYSMHVILSTFIKQMTVYVGDMEMKEKVSVQ